MNRLADEAAYFGAVQDGVESQQELIESLRQQLATSQKQIVMLRDAATQLLGRKRPNQTDDDPRLILEIDCLNLEDALAATADLKEQGK